MNKWGKAVLATLSTAALFACSNESNETAEGSAESDTQQDAPQEEAPAPKTRVRKRRGEN